MPKVLSFKNNEIAAVANFLGDIKLKNKASRGRSKLIKILINKDEDYREDLNSTRKLYFQANENGELITQKDPKTKTEHYIFKDPKQKTEFAKEIREIENESAVISLTEYSEKIKNLYIALDGLDQELSDQEALIYDTIMDQFDEAYGNPEEEE